MRITYLYQMLQLITRVGYGSSIPFFGRLVEWSITPVLKTGNPQGFLGSNPRASASSIRALSPYRIFLVRAVPKMDEKEMLPMEYIRYCPQCKRTKMHLVANGGALPTWCCSLCGYSQTIKDIVDDLRSKRNRERG